MKHTFLALRNVSADILEIYSDLTAGELDEALGVLIDGISASGGLAEKLAEIFVLEGKKQNVPDPISASIKRLEEEIAVALPGASRSELEFVGAQLIDDVICSIGSIGSPSFEEILADVRSQGQGGDK